MPPSTSMERRSQQRVGPGRRDAHLVTPQPRGPKAGGPVAAFAAQRTFRSLPMHAISSPVDAHKMALPSAGGQVERVRPLAALRNALRQSPITWLLGLPGAGKTSLAACWAAQAQAEGATVWWYRLDEDD